MIVCVVCVWVCVCVYVWGVHACEPPLFKIYYNKLTNHSHHFCFSSFLSLVSLQETSGEYKWWVKHINAHILLHFTSPGRLLTVWHGSIYNKLFLRCLWLLLYIRSCSVAKLNRAPKQKQYHHFCFRSNEKAIWRVKKIYSFFVMQISWNWNLFLTRQMPRQNQNIFYIKKLK